MNELSGRQLAWKVLDKIEIEAAYTNIALREITKKYPPDRRELSFCTELVYGVMRNLLKIDYFLERLLSRNLASLNPSVKNILRLALYQLLFLPRIPERAVCHETVAQVKKSKFKGLASLVNGVLRSYLRMSAEISLPKKETDLAEFLQFEYSHPHWLVKRWLNDFGPDLAERILKVNNEKAPLSLRLNLHRAARETILKELDSAQVEWSPGLHLPAAITVTALPGSLEELPLFQNGYLFVQDESSMLVGLTLQPLPGEFLVDLCAAPGGKSTHLAELMGDQGLIRSVDDHQHKIKLIQENTARLHLNCIQPAMGDARNFKLETDVLADGVLVDAPCSGTGVLRRRVDARYRKKPKDIEILVTLQREILNNAAGLVKPGGRLVYSTCSLEREEDEAQVEWFRVSHPEFEIENYQNYLPLSIKKQLVTPTSPWAKIFPVSEGGDGFFICRFRRNR